MAFRSTRRIVAGLQHLVVPAQSGAVRATTFSTARLLHKDDNPQEPTASEEEASFPPFEEHMLYSLVCPVSKKPLWYDKVNSRLISEEALLAYPVEDGIPWLIPLHAKSLSKEDLEQIRVELNVINNAAPQAPNPSPVQSGSSEGKDTEIH